MCYQAREGVDHSTHRTRSQSEDRMFKRDNTSSLAIWILLLDIWHPHSSDGRFDRVSHRLIHQTLLTMFFLNHSLCRPFYSSQALPRRVIRHANGK